MPSPAPTSPWMTSTARRFGAALTLWSWPMPSGHGAPPPSAPRRKRMRRLLGPDYRNPDRAPEHRHGERHDPSPPQGRRSGQPFTAGFGSGDVPLFPNTPEGQAERLAYYEARKLNHLPHSLLDYNDVIHGRETPAERRARERRATSPIEPRPRGSTVKRRLARRPAWKLRTWFAPGSSAREPAGPHAGQRCRVSAKTRQLEPCARGELERPRRYPPRLPRPSEGSRRRCPAGGRRGIALLRSEGLLVRRREEPSYESREGERPLGAREGV